MDADRKEKIERKKTRLIRPVGGAKHKLLVEDKIVWTFIYLRQGVTFKIFGLIFHISESLANEIFNYWQKIFRNALPSSLLEQIQKTGESEEYI